MREAAQGAARDAKLKKLGLAPNSDLEEGSPFSEEEADVFERIKREADIADIEAFDSTWHDRIIRGLWSHNKGSAKLRFEQTKEAFRKISTWRRENNIDTILTRKLKGSELVMKHIRTTVGGDDLYGHIVWVEQLVEVAALCSCDLTSKEIVMVRAQTTEAMENIKMSLSSKLGLIRYKQVYVLDLAPLALVPLFQRSEVRKLTTEIMALGTQYYPEGMWKVFIINAPLIFRTVYAMLSPMINPVTKEKVKILGPPSKYLKEMERNGIPLESVPKLIGGKHPGRCMINEIRDHIVGAAAAEEHLQEEPVSHSTHVDKTTAIKSERLGAREPPAINPRLADSPYTKARATATKNTSLRRKGNSTLYFLCCAGPQAVVDNGIDEPLRMSTLPLQYNSDPLSALMPMPNQAMPKLGSFEEEKQGDDVADQPQRSKQGGKIHPLEPANAGPRKITSDLTGNSLLVVPRAPRTASISQRTGKFAVAASFVVFVIWFVYI